MFGEFVGQEKLDAAADLVFRELPVDFPLNVSVVRSYADAGKPGAVADS